MTQAAPDSGLPGSSSSVTYTEMLVLPGSCAGRGGSDGLHGAPDLTHSSAQWDVPISGGTRFLLHPTMCRSSSIQVYCSSINAYLALIASRVQGGGSRSLHRARWGRIISPIQTRNLGLCLLWVCCHENCQARYLNGGCRRHGHSQGWQGAEKVLLISLGTLLGVLGEDSGPTDSVVISGAAPGTHVPQCLGPSEPSYTLLCLQEFQLHLGHCLCIMDRQEYGDFSLALWGLLALSHSASKAAQLGPGEPHGPHLPRTPGSCWWGCLHSGDRAPADLSWSGEIRTEGC